MTRLSCIVCALLLGGCSSSPPTKAAPSPVAVVPAPVMPPVEVKSPPPEQKATAAAAAPAPAKPPRKSVPAVEPAFDPQDAKRTALWLGSLKMSAFRSRMEGNLFAAGAKERFIQGEFLKHIDTEIRWTLPITFILPDGTLLVGGYLIHEVNPKAVLSSAEYIFDAKNIMLNTPEGVRLKQHYELGIEAAPFRNVSEEWLATVKIGDMAVVSGRIKSWKTQEGSGERTTCVLEGARVSRP